MTACRSLLRATLVALTSATLVLFTSPALADTLQDIHKLLKQGQQAQALEKTEKYLASKPKDAQGRFLKGLILTEMNRTAEAIAVFTKLTEDYPELPEPYNNLAVIYAQQKQYEKAKQALEMAIRTHPSYATAHENLGDIYARLASQAYDKALQIDSANTSAQTKLAMIRDLMTTSSRPAAGLPATKPAVVALAPAAAEAKPEPKSEVKPEVKSEVKSESKSEPKPAAKPVENKAAPAPVPVSEAKTAAGEASSEIDKTLEAWAAAWSKKNVKAYLGYYARDFQTPGGESRAAWEAERARRVSKPGGIQVSFDNLRVTTEGADRATAKFRQHYRSASLKTSSNKVLVLVRHEGKWLIQQERVGR
ncbi:MAG: tetratricopeptide repeat protein [Betaproteobacteria bacterium]|nr:tetratricopeptide repeat protein [Betaproteobacteria bacterium]